MTDIITAILKINPNAKCVVENEDFEQITWLDGTTPISKDEIQAKQVEMDTAKTDLKASAKAKLVAGEALTEEEADTIVL